MYIKKIVVLMLIMFSFVFISCNEDPEIIVSEDYLIERITERISEVKQYAYDFFLDYSVENNMSSVSRDGELIEISSNESFNSKTKAYIDKKNRELFSNSTIYGWDDYLNMDVSIISLGILLEDDIYNKQIFSQEYIEMMNNMLDYSDMMSNHGVGKWSQSIIGGEFMIDEYFLRMDALETYLSMIKSGTLEVENEKEFYVLKVFPDSLELIEIITEASHQYTNFEGLPKDELFKFYEVEAKVSKDTYDLISVKINSDMLLKKELMGDNFFPSDSQRVKHSLDITFKEFNEKRELEAPI